MKQLHYDFAQKATVGELFTMLHTNKHGLSEEFVDYARKKYGANKIDKEEKESLFKKIFKAYITPFNVVLLCLAIMSFVTDYVMAAPGERDMTAVVIIFIMVLASGSMSLYQSIRSGDAAEKLLKMVRVTATVTRVEGGKQEIPVEEIVCGDIVHLSAGDMIPADMRLIEAKDLFVSESAMTGESAPVEKCAIVVEKATATPLESENLVFMGSNVVSGSATAVVVQVGNDTFFGGIAKEVAKEKVHTSFELGVRSVSWLLIRFMAVMVPIIFFINGMTSGDWLEAFLFGLSVAVGLTPEMLPMIVNSNLVKGALTLSKKRYHY